MRAADFALFHEEVHGSRPFPWQRDLVFEILERGSWPALVDVPTGLGKTTLLDIAIFLSALESDRITDNKVGRRRVFFVVDRRIVVDQAARHADHIRRRLEAAPKGSITAEVESRLRSLAGPSANDGVLPTVTMRGGITWDAAWLSRPDQPGIITGTVDQVGSRLFFRGYGLSHRRWPIDAALVGTDSLVLVDEAHLATALTTSLDSAASYDSSATSLPIPRPAVVQLTATARETAGWMPAFDEAAHLMDPVAAARITAAKALRLHQVAKTAASTALATAAADEAAVEGARVLVVCNTIDRARDVHSRLKRTLPHNTDVLLLIGRSRAIDREMVVKRALELFSPHRNPGAESAVLVATQTVEVGIDLDASALVTECASWDALIQRIGRVNRRGLRAAGNVVVIQDDDEKPPVYGEARLRTAEFITELLETSERVDVSPLALRHLKAPPDTILPPPRTPLLLSAHLDAWARTSPPPVNDAPLDAYLHGIDSGVAPVSVVWRDGILRPDGSPVTVEEANLVVDAIPVRTEECVEVPIAAVRRWLTDSKPTPVSDWDDDDDWEVPFGEDTGSSVLRRTTQPDGTANWAWVSPSELRPGDLVVVPAEQGGLDIFGWNPASRERVLDVSELVALERSQPALRLDSELPRRLGLSEPDPNLWELLRTWQETDDPQTRTETERSCERLVRKWLDTAIADLESPWNEKDRRQTLAQAVTSAEMQAVRTQWTGADPRSTLVLPVAIIRPNSQRVPWREVTDDTVDGSVHVQRRVTLAEHGRAVGLRAEEISRCLGLPDDVVMVVTDAARWHDWGKVDPRFQAMLFEGDPIRAAIAAEPLAKSGMPPGDLQRHRDARRRSGLPRGARHEAWSQALVTRHLATESNDYLGDIDLLLHLVASHHGHARPLLPAIQDAAEHDLTLHLDEKQLTVALPRTVDLSHAERFAVLNQRYGRWGLALLEAIVRCADMTISGEGS